MTNSPFHSELDDDLPDGDLLRRFIQDSDHHAFAAIVRRYQCHVLAVCRRVLRNESDVEDAFQSTFLTLARRPKQVRKVRAISGWLYTVAWRKSWRILRARRAFRTEALDQCVSVTTEDSLERISSAQDCLVLDEELNHLPARYREVLVMTYFAKQTSQQIADQLGVSKGTIDGRIRESRNRLRIRLARRGISIGVLPVAAGTMGHSNALAVECLTDSTIQLGTETITSGVPATTELSHIEPFIHAETTIMTTKTLCTVLVSFAAIVGIAGMSNFDQKGDGLQVQSEATGRVVTSPATRTTQIEPFVKDLMDENYQDNSALIEVAVNTVDAGQRSAEQLSQIEAAGSKEQSTEVFSLYPANGSSTEKWIYAALEDPAPPLHFEAATSLQGLLDQIAQHETLSTADFHLRIVPDFHELDHLGIKSLAEVEIKEFDCSGSRLRSALNLMCAQTDPELTWRIENDVMLITSLDKEQQRFTTRVYEVGDLVSLDDGQTSGSESPGGGGLFAVPGPIDGPKAVRTQTSRGEVERRSGGPRQAENFSLVDLIQAMAAPDSWFKNGADPGGDAMIAGSKLVVRQTQKGHEEIADLLNLLAAATQVE